MMKIHHYGDDMQTFLPYPDFEKSAKVLDYKRLGKQRVEAMQVYNIVSGKRTMGGWINHPTVKMWKNYPDALALYHNYCIKEWIKRGYNNTMKIIDIPENIVMPRWLGDERLHSSHRSNLLRKDSEYYGKYNWTETAGIPYFWCEEYI